MKRSLILLLLALSLSACYADITVPFHWLTPEADLPVVSQPIATPEAPVEPPDLPDATAIAIEMEEADQIPCDVKVNVSASGELVYHVPGGVYYDRVKIDPEQGDSWACSAEEAEALGARPSTR